MDVSRPLRCGQSGSNLLTAADPDDADEWRREALDRLCETIRESDWTEAMVVAGISPHPY